MPRRPDDRPDPSPHAVMRDQAPRVVCATSAQAADTAGPFSTRGPRKGEAQQPGAPLRHQERLGPPFRHRSSALMTHAVTVNHQVALCNNSHYVLVRRHCSCHTPGTPSS